jgi:hypothetical protein
LPTTWLVHATRDDDADQQSDDARTRRQFKNYKRKTLKKVRENANARETFTGGRYTHETFTGVRFRSVDTPFPRPFPTSRGALGHAVFRLVQATRFNSVPRARAGAHSQANTRTRPRVNNV